MGYRRFLYNIIDFIKQNLQSIINNKDKFSKTAKEIWARGTYSGCSDFALVFETISRQLKILTIHLQMADIEWIKQISNGVTPPIVRGHNACECYINNRWVYVDPINRKINFEYDKNNLKINDKYMVFAKSTDIFETGVNSLEKNNTTMQNLFKTKHLTQI